MSRNTQLVKNTAILGVGLLIPKIISIIVLPILTFSLTTSEYGTYDLINTIVGLLVPIITLQLQQALFRKLIIVQNVNERKKYINTALFFIFVTTVCCIPIIILSLKFVKFDFVTSIYVCILLITQELYELLGQVVRGIGQNIIYSKGAIIYAVCNLLSLCVVVFLFKTHIFGILFSMILGFIMATLYLLITSKIYRYIDVQSFSKKNLEEMLKFSVPLVPNSISLWIVNLSDRVIISAVLGVAANGIYSVATKLPQIYTSVYNIFNLAWTETASRSVEDNDVNEYYSELFDTLLKFLVGVMLFMMAILPIAFRILISENYAESYYQLPILFMAVFFNSIVGYYGGIYIAFGKTKKVAISSVAGACVNILVNLLLISKIRIYAASISTLISYFLIVVYRYFDVNRVVKIHYNMISIIWSIFILVIMSILCYVRSVPSIFISLILAVLYNIIYNKKIAVTGLDIIKRKLRK